MALVVRVLRDVLVLLVLVVVTLTTVLTAMLVVERLTLLQTRLVGERGPPPEDILDLLLLLVVNHLEL